MESETSIRGIGLMCGTSRDGLDLCDCTFQRSENSWTYFIHGTATYLLPSQIIDSLDRADAMSGIELMLLRNRIGQFEADCVNHYLEAIPTDAHASFVASHGITIFHQPEIGLTTQLNNGAILAAATGIRSITDFRTVDVAKGGQGAPLVPIGDLHLFPEWDACLNLGGFANVTLKTASGIRAFDVCPCNLPLNSITKTLNGENFDKNGQLAASGRTNNAMIEALNQLDYYQLTKPKSLGTEWLDEVFMSVVNQYDIPEEDKLASVTQHIAKQVGRALQHSSKCLITGGGAFNTYLIEQIAKASPCPIELPDTKTIAFKEALIFAFLGALNLSGIPNVLASCTGAQNDSIGGYLHHP